ncbi:histidine kinase [candidate division KSB1 bacterium]|nr:histidine kinase [candidate division KSB1 bacterium]
MNVKTCLPLVIAAFMGIIVIVLFYLGQPLSQYAFWIALGSAGLGAAAAWYLISIFRQRQRMGMPATKTEMTIGLPWQLNMLFLFNTLHNISALTLLDPEKARSTIEQLAELIRLLNDINKSERTLLAQEVRCAERLLAIEAARLGDRMSIGKEIAPECMEESLPSLILLPLVENAIQHSVELSEETVHITLRAYYHQQWLFLEVSDSGKSTAKIASDTSSVESRLAGLHPLLQKHYGNRYVLKTIPLSPSGTMVRLQLPQKYLG